MMLAPYERECRRCEEAFEPEADEAECPDCREEGRHG